MARRERPTRSWLLTASGFQSLPQEEKEPYEDKSYAITSVKDSLRGSSAVEEHDAAGAWAEYTGIPWHFWQEWGCMAAWPNVVFKWKEIELSRVRKNRSLTATNNKSKCTWTERPPFAILWPSPSDGDHTEIWLTEGESDCGVLRFLGYDAYTLGSATQSVGPVTLQLLQEIGVQKVHILYDVDQAGQDGAKRLAEALVVAGLEVRILNLLIVRKQYEKDISDILRYRGQLAVRTAMEELDKYSEVVDDIRLDVVLQGDEEIDWLWYKLIPYGTVSLLTGPPKTMKTNLLYFMMAAAADGTTVLGRQFMQSRVLYCSEMPLAIDRTRANRILVKSRDHLFIRHEYSHVFAGKPWVEKVAILEQDIKRYNIEFLIIDTASAWFGFVEKEENNATAIRNAFAPLRRLADKYQVTTLVVHHPTKSGDTPRGSGAWEAVPDVLITQDVNATGNIELRARGRVGGAKESIEWGWPEDSDGPIVYSETSSETGTLGRLDEKIMEVLKDMGEASTRDVASALEGHELTNVRRALKNLASKGLVAMSKDEMTGGYMWSKFSISLVTGDED